MSEKREEDLVVMVRGAGEIIIDASDEVYFDRLVRDGWEVQEEAVVKGPGFLCGHATRSRDSTRRDE